MLSDGQKTRLSLENGDSRGFVASSWFTNQNTRRAYRNDVCTFMRFIGINSPQEFRPVRRAHVIGVNALKKNRMAAIKCDG
jgi:hypothetical protein